MSRAPLASAGKYDRQLILALLGSADDDAALAQAQALERKPRQPPLPGEVVAMRRAAPPGAPPGALAEARETDALQRALAGRRQVPLPVGPRSWLYLVGAGDPGSRTVAGGAPESVAAALAAAGLLEVGLISIVADGGGRDPARDEAAKLDAEAASFASLLHRALREVHGVATRVHARVGAVRVFTQATPVGAAVLDAGRKLTARRPGGDAGEHSAPLSKLNIRWDGERQLREWSY